MAKPIRERGIRWVETYGDKSTHLKREMHDQIGPGSYFRWEGHDSTTGNDYYVVVSPGFSKKKGYFFFAGLRKMPADHGASGKKFSTQAEALTHAFETWGVPRPQEKPAKPYTTNDIVNKPIIMEIQHKAASEPNRIIVAEKMERKAMGLPRVMRACGLGTNWQRLTTQKHYPSALCGGIQNSGTMGMLAGFYNQLSIVGIDGYNQESSSEYEYSPIIATCQEADEDGVQSATKESWSEKPLFELPRGAKKYIFRDPRKDSEDENYQHRRWKDVTIGLMTKIPYRLYSRASILIENLLSLNKAFQDKKAIEIKLPNFNQDQPVGPQIEAYLRSQNSARTKNKKAKSPNSSINMNIYVIAELYLKVKNTINEFMIDPILKQPLTAMPRQETVSLAGIIDQLAEEKNMKEGMPYDPEQVIAERSKISGSQFFYFDDHGMPFMLGNDKANGLIPRSLEDKPSSSNTLGGQFRNSLNGSKRLIADNAVAGLDALGKEYEKLLYNQKLFVDLRRANPSSPQLKAEAAKVAAQTKKLMAVAKALKLQRGGNQGAAQKFLGLCDNYVNQRVAVAELSSANKKYDFAKMNEAYKAVKPYFFGFRALAALGMVDINPNRYVHAQTCAPVESQIYIKAYDTDAAGVPKDTKSLLSVPPHRAVLPETPIGATRHGDKLVARQFERGEEGWEETLVEVDPAKANQVTSGAHLYVEKASQNSLFYGEGEGAPSFVTVRPMPRLDPNSSGRYITGGAKAVLARPVGFSPQKTGGGEDFGGGWEILQEKFEAREKRGVPSANKQWPGSKLSLPEPDRQNDFFNVVGPRGESFNVADSMYKDEDSVKWRDYTAMASFLRDKFCLSDDLIGCITQTTDSDMFISRDYQETAKHVYRTTEDYKRKIQDPIFIKAIKLGQNISQGKAPDGITKEQSKAALDAFQLSQEFAALRKEPEFNSLYNFGNICQYCETVDKGGMGDTMDPRVVAMFEKALADPRSSLRPKSGTLYGIKFTTNDKSGGKSDQWFQNPNESDPMLFSSRMSPWIRQYFEHCKRTMPESNPRIEVYAANDILVPSVKRNTNLVHGREALEKRIFAMKGQQPPVEEWGDDVPYSKKADETGQEEDLADEVAGEETAEEPLEPTAPEVPPQAPQTVKPIPPVLTGPAIMYSKEQAEETLRQRLRPVFNQLAGVDLNNLAAAPPDVVVKAKRILNNIIGLISKINPKMKPHLDANLNEYLVKFNLDKLYNYNPPLPGPVATVVEKLIRLANRLDDDGRADEAETVDKVITATIKKAGR